MWLKILAWLPFIFIFLASIYQPIDADLGWHLKYGEYFFGHGQILRDNIFSTEMPDYHWPNSSWGTDLISYLTYHLFGFLGLTILSALVVTFSFYFFSKAAKLTIFEQTLIFPILVYFISPVNSVSFRGQLLSLLLTGVLFYLLSLYEAGKSKILWLIPLLFLIWANLHGQFFLGLIILIAWLVIYLVRNQHAFKQIILVVLASIAVTFINPFCANLYSDILAHSNNPFLQYIAEYLPYEQLSDNWWNQVILGFLVLFGLLFTFFSDSLRKKLPWVGPLILFYALSFAVRRYSWTMYYLAMPILAPVAGYFKPDSDRITKISSAVILSGLITFVVWIKYPFSQYVNYNWEDYCQKLVNCSPRAVQFLIDNHLENDLLTFYNWGGYMIWNYPQIKPSIDGRMHLWQDDNGYSAFTYYYPFEQNITDIDRSKYQVVLMSKDKPMTRRLEELATAGKWKLVYSDQTAVIYIRLIAHIE